MNELETIDRPALDLHVSRPAAVVLEEARTAASALRDVLQAKPRKVIISGKQYLEFEDWLTVARFYGASVRVRSTEPVQFGDVQGWQATADVHLVSSGQLVSSAESMCLNDEERWGKRPLFQLRSMAQTRACAKALRNVFAWVVVLAGFQPTPAEEMDQQERKSSAHGTGLRVLQERARQFAEQGLSAYQSFFVELPAAQKKALADTTHVENKVIAQQADAAQAEEESGDERQPGDEPPSGDMPLAAPEQAIIDDAKGGSTSRTGLAEAEGKVPPKQAGEDRAEPASPSSSQDAWLDACTVFRDAAEAAGWMPIGIGVAVDEARKADDPAKALRAKAEGLAPKRKK